MKRQFDNMYMIFRGIGIIHQLSPYNLLAKCVRSVSNAALPFVNYYMSAAIIDSLIEFSSLRTLVLLVVITLLINLALVLISKEMDAINYRKWHEFYMRYNLSIGEKAQSLPYSKIEDHHTHLMIKNLDDAMKIGNYGLIKLHSRIPLLVENLCKVIFSVSLILSVILQKTTDVSSALQTFANSGYADGVLIAFVVFSAFSYIVANKKIAVMSYEHLGRLSKNNRSLDYYMEQYLDGHKAGKDIRLYRQDRLIIDEVKNTGNKNSSIVDCMNRRIFNCNCWIALSNFLLTAYTYLYVGGKALAGAFAVGSIVKYSGGVLQFATAFSGMMDAFSQLQANSKYLKDYFAFMDMPSEDEITTPQIKKELRCRLEVDHVSFRYPGSQEYALKDISFTIEFGEKVAIVGQNGSGKTTMIKLLCRLYEPTEGTIRCNGVDIREYSREQYMSMLSVVFQDFKLFSFTLGENVASKMNYDPEKVENCLEKVGMEKRIQQMQNGLNTYLYKDFDPEGVEISGGEAQKIAMARAIYKNSPLLILDEPTAALDPIAEAEIYSKIYKIAGDHTSIFISHRLSSCRFCNRILVFKDGNMVQEGSHEQLLEELEGCYLKLWNAQAQYYQ